jgi:aminoglycoside/choline kinase family phosphotransferase
MTDFGSQTYLDVLSGNKLGMFRQELYSAAIDSLINIQTKVIPWGLQDYSEELSISEMSLFPKWYLEKFKKFKLQDQEKFVLNKIFSEIAGYSAGEVFVHRDYHSRNLMFIKDGGPGILDYQDAVVGHCTYDLVSLLKDAYIELDEEFIVEQVARYWEKVENFDPDYLEWQAPKLDPLEQFERGAPAYFKHFYKDFEMMGVQRHLKILGIFSRLSIRDKKDQYLKDIPLVEKYLMCTTERYESLHPLRRILDKVVS